MRKKDFVKYWNEHVLCNLSSKSSIRKEKKKKQKEKQYARKFVRSENDNIDVTMDQVKNLYEYMSEENDGTKEKVD